MPKKKTRKPARKAAKKSSKKKPVRKKVAKKKAVARKPARKPARKAVPKAVAEKAAPRPAMKPAAPSMPVMEKKPPVPAVTGQKVGVVIHYYTHLGVAVIRLDQGQLQVGDTIHVKGHTTDFKQTVESMEVEHQKIQRATAGQEFGLKVVDHAREHDEVYKVMG